MILGYNTERPKAEDYKDFENKLVSGLNSLKIDELSLMLYGSYIRGDYNPGRSDIDAVLIFPNDVVINKENLHNASVVLRSALKGNNVPFQVSVSDITTLRDGRFNSYDESFKDYFEEEARITGTDYRTQIKYELPTLNEQVPVRFNLRKIRTGLLFAEHDMNEDYESFLKKFTKSLDAVSRSSKQILYFEDKQLRKNRFSAAQSIKSFYPEIDISPLVKIRELYQNLEKMDELFRKPEEIVKIWNSSVTFMEEMIKYYLERHQRNSD